MLLPLLVLSWLLHQDHTLKVKENISDTASVHWIQMGNLGLYVFVFVLHAFGPFWPRLSATRWFTNSRIHPLLLHFHCFFLFPFFNLKIKQWFSKSRDDQMFLKAFQRCLSVFTCILECVHYLPGLMPYAKHTQHTGKPLGVSWLQSEGAAGTLRIFIMHLVFKWSQR